MRIPTQKPYIGADFLTWELAKERAQNLNTSVNGTGRHSEMLPHTTYMNNIINRRFSMENTGLVYKDKQHNVINKT